MIKTQGGDPNANPSNDLQDWKPVSDIAAWQAQQDRAFVHRVTNEEKVKMEQEHARGHDFKAGRISVLDFYDGLHYKNLAPNDSSVTWTGLPENQEPERLKLTILVRSAKNDLQCRLEFAGSDWKAESIELVQENSAVPFSVSYTSGTSKRDNPSLPFLVLDSDVLTGIWRNTSGLCVKLAIPLREIFVDARADAELRASMSAEERANLILENAKKDTSARPI